MEFRPKTIDDFCRLCAIESQSGVIIYSTEGENLCLEEKIISCLRIEVSRDDLLPKKVCQLCSELLEDYHRFSERAVQVQQTLGHIFGIHTSCGPQDEMQLCLMETNVKVESNVIKNELDELNQQQNSIQIENEKFDLSLGMMVGSEYQNEEATKDLVFDAFDELNSFTVRDEFNFPNRILNEVRVDNVRQIHRRKMTQPKKAPSCGTAPVEKLKEQKELKEVEDMKCLISSTNENDTDFKAEALNDCEYIEDIDAEVNVPVKVNDKKEKEDTEVEKEWRKHWGIMCDQCSNIFPSRAVFDKHYRLCCNKKPVYTCSFCKMAYTKYSEYRSHSLTHIYEGQFECEFCGKKFCMKAMLDVHVMTHNGTGGSFICEECGLEFPSQKRLSVHQKKHNPQAQKEFRCPECGKVLQTRGGLTAHLTVHKLGRRFMCHLCGKTFTQKINMQQHVKHHRGEKPYACEDCGKAFTEKSHLNRHKSFHTLDRPFQCPICKKMYKTERCLKVHSHVHLNTRPYICTLCGKGFLSSTKLKQHYNCHTGERPFACKYCERTFTNYPNWLKHTRRRHKVDHKTGLSLKEEESQPKTGTRVDAVNNNNVTVLNGGLEFFEMPGIEVKEDGDRDSVQSIASISQQPMPQVVPQTGIIQFQESPSSLPQFEMHSVPELNHPQDAYPIQETAYFGMSFKEI